jgi:hypothetical protein
MPAAQRAGSASNQHLIKKKTAAEREAHFGKIVRCGAVGAALRVVISQYNDVVTAGFRGLPNEDFLVMLKTAHEPAAEPVVTEDRDRCVSRNAKDDLMCRSPAAGAER